MPRGKPGKKTERAPTICFQPSEAEREILETYCQQQERTMTDVLRELIRGLKVKPKSDRP